MATPYGSRAANTAIKQYRLIYQNPGQAGQQMGFHSAGNDQSARNQVDLLWAYYNNSIFDTAERSWRLFKNRYGLYRNTRSLINPTMRVVEFYANSIYPGVLSDDGDKLPGNQPLAIPLADDVPAKLRQAVAQLWEWSNWQTWMSIVVLWSAATGATLVEVVDDVDHGQVYFDAIWPGYVTDLELDKRGNVKAYSIEYQVADPKAANNQLYTYRKEVTGQTIKVYRDKTLQSTEANPFGFAPAVWYKHKDNGSVFGEAAMLHSIPKINEINDQLSHLNDHISKVIEYPMLLTSDKGGFSNLFGKPKRGATAEKAEPGQPKPNEVDPTDDRQQIFMLTGPADAKVTPLLSNLDISGTLEAIERIYQEIEADHPEITFWDKLREMSQVTGPAASQLVGDVLLRVQKAASQYDKQTVKLFQMGVAVGGFRANAGDWGDRAELSDGQRKFLPYDLDSYRKGKLKMTIMPRPLIAPTEDQLADSRSKKWASIEAESSAGVPLEMILEDEEGWTPEKLAKLKQLKEAAQREQQQTFSQGQPQTQTQPASANQGGTDQTNQATQTNQPDQASKSKAKGTNSRKGIQ